MKRGIFINLTILFILLLVTFSPVLVMFAMDRMGQANGCNMSAGGGSPGPDPCGTIVAILFVAGWSAIAIVPIGVGGLLLYGLGVVIFYIASLVRGRRAGQAASPLASGMLFSTLAVALVIGVVVGIIAGWSWYQTSFISACQGLPAPAALAGVRSGPLALSARLPGAGTDDMTSMLIVSPGGEVLARVDNLRSGRDPAWSPDGQRLAFTARSWDSNQFGLYWMDRQGQVSPPLFADARLEIHSPDWTPDGELIFDRWVETNGSVNSELFVASLAGDASADSSRLRSLPGSPGYDGAARVSPDGRQIVFVSERDGQSDIYRMDWDGSNVLRLTRGSDNEIHPAWSPDGRWIVFATNRDSQGSRNNYNLYVMAPDGTNQCRLTQGEDSEWHPVWSPDGMWIAYISLLERKVYLVRPDGTQTAPLPLAEDLADATGLDWAVESGN